MNSIKSIGIEKKTEDGRVDFFEVLIVISDSKRYRHICYLTTSLQQKTKSTVSFQ